MNLIFDIDGTLVQSYGFDTICYAQALQDVLGKVRLRPDWGDYADVTDRGIFQGICADNGLGALDETPLKTRFTALVADHLARDPSACLATPGAPALMADLTARPGINIGIATGGWGATARAKLTHAGVPFDPTCVFSTDHATARTEIMLACHRAIAQPNTPTIYIGDGTWDMAATADLGWNFIGIGPRLMGQCDYWLPDFTGTGFTELVHKISGFS
jgi:phosphoglycolate phosphatase-like HAD superfamily hydrolase